MNQKPESGKKGKTAIRSCALFFAAVSFLSLLCIGAWLGIRSYAPAAPRVESTASATPFGPAAETPTARHPYATRTPTETAAATLWLLSPTPSGEAPPWAPYAGPIKPSPTPIPTPAAEIPQGDQTLNIALLGIDKSETEPPYRTDVIMILSLDRENQTAALISFPRDLFVYIPAYSMQRINIAFGQASELHYPGGGFALFRDTMAYNFGIRVDHYALMNFQGFKEMIDRLGGIDVDAEKPLSDYRFGYGTWRIPSGVTHMDGSLALWYTRARKTTSDFDRARRQQEVIMAIAQRLLDLRAIPNLPGFFKIFMQYFESDLTLEDITPYAELAASLPLSSLRRFRITYPDGCSNWITPQGAMVLLPKPDAIRAMLEEALHPAAIDIADKEG
jgi:LCP family protein required for cell wall assembly